jgi:hypothetical protein
MLDGLQHGQVSYVLRPEVLRGIGCQARERTYLVSISSVCNSESVKRHSDGRL